MRFPASKMSEREAFGFARRLFWRAKKPLGFSLVPRPGEGRASFSRINP